MIKKESKFRLWAARDKNAPTVWLFSKKPSLNEKERVFFSRSLDEVMGNVDGDILPEVTYENSPVEYEITFKRIKL